MLLLLTRSCYLLGSFSKTRLQVCAAADLYADLRIMGRYVHILKFSRLCKHHIHNFRSIGLNEYHVQEISDAFDFSARAESIQANQILSRCEETPFSLPKNPLSKQS